MPSLMEKVGQPCCPKCGVKDWSAKKDGVCDQSMIDFVTEKAKEEGKDVLEYLKYVFLEDVVFIFCYSCGYTLNAMQVDEGN